MANRKDMSCWANLRTMVDENHFYDYIIFAQYMDNPEYTDKL